MAEAVTVVLKSLYQLMEQLGETGVMRHLQLMVAGYFLLGTFLQVPVAHAQETKGIAVYPFSAKGGADGAVAEGLSSYFTAQLAKSPCARIVAEDVIRDLSKQMALEQSCGTESCQIDLAKAAKADLMVRGELAEVGPTKVLSVLMIDIGARRNVLSLTETGSDGDLLVMAEKHANTIRGSLKCKPGSADRNEPTSVRAPSLLMPGAKLLGGPMTHVARKPTASMICGETASKLPEIAPRKVQGKLSLRLRDVRQLPFRVTDVEYDKTTDNLVLIDADARVLAILDPTTGKGRRIELGRIPKAVSVSLSGGRAAVGHDAMVSEIDLSEGMLVKSVPVEADVWDIVSGPGRYAYVAPAADQHVRLHVVDFETELESASKGRTLYEKTRIRMQPGEFALYGADNGISPSDIEKICVEGGEARYLYDSPYHGDYPMCGNLWFSEDARFVYTACGRVFRTSLLKDQDMKYAGAIEEIERIESLDHSAEIGKLVLIEGGERNRSLRQDREIDPLRKLYLVDERSLARELEVLLPDTRVGSGTVYLSGRYVFFNAVGTIVYVIAEASPSAAAGGNGFLVTYDLGAHH